jgi:hypothetical protein
LVSPSASTKPDHLLLQVTSTGYDWLVLNKLQQSARCFYLSSESLRLKTIVGNTNQIQPV